MNASEIMAKKAIKTKLLQYLEGEMSKEELLRSCTVLRWGRENFNTSMVCG